MRRPAVALISVALVATLLAGCSGGSGSTASPSPSGSTPSATSTSDAADTAALAGVKVTGALGATPTLAFTQPFSVTAPVARLDKAGSGAVITATDLLEINYVAVNGDDGTVLGSTWDSKSPGYIGMSDTQLVPALIGALVGQKLGSRVLFAVPGTAATATSEAAPATILAIEADKVVPSRAVGEAVTPPAGLPKVTVAANGEPSITVPAGTTKPTTLVAQTLIKGSGPAVTSGQTVTFQYSGWLFDGTLFDSSWTKGTPFTTPIGSGQVIKGWDQGLVGQTVGSQVLLVIPPDLAYGETGSGETIPPNSTLIFVVDILAAG